MNNKKEAGKKAVQKELLQIPPSGTYNTGRLDPKNLLEQQLIDGFEKLLHLTRTGKKNIIELIERIDDEIES